MILNLRTKNFALISDASLDFGEGFTVITGETGSGKSLLVNSLGLLSGQKGETGWIREGCNEAVVEGVFELHENSPAKGVLEEAGITFETPLVVRRVLIRQGRNRVFINDCASTLGTLKRLSPFLMEIQSQRDHHSFLHPSRHTSILDDYAGLRDLHQRYLELYREKEHLQREIEEMGKNAAERLRQMEFLRFQIRELEEAHLVEGEEESLRKAREVLSKAARCKEAIANAAGRLSEDEPSAHSLLSSALGILEEWKDLKDEIASGVEALEGALAVVEDQALRLLSVAGELSEDPERLQEIEERLDMIARFRPKYGETVKDMLNYLEKAKRELAQLEERQEGQEGLKDRLEEVESQVWQVGEELQEKREAAARGFCERVQETLRRLRLEQARLKVEISRRDPGPWGIGKVEFLIEPNPGEGMRPLWKVASGGELSRITLAIHSLLSHRGDCDLWVLDEIDTGIGGETAVEVGRLLREISGERQILCITHMPQIAAFGEHHFRVVKRVERERTVTLVSRLTKEESREELKRMMGGEGVPFSGESDGSD